VCDPATDDNLRCGLVMRASGDVVRNWSGQSRLLCERGTEKKKLPIRLLQNSP
jgi:hypothetical protein